MEPEDDLLQKAQSGDQAALSALLRAHAPEVRRAVAGKIPAQWKNLLSEDDVLQQTFTDAFVGISRFVPIGPDVESAFAAWLKAMARNSLVDALRTLEAEKRGGGRRAVAPGTNGSESMEAFYLDLFAETQTSPSQDAARGEAVSALEEAVAKLPETYGRVVRLLDLEGRPIDEVAALLERSPGACYLLRNRAHKRLRELMGTGSRFFSESP